MVLRSCCRCHRQLNYADISRFRAVMWFLLAFCVCVTLSGRGSDRGGAILLACHSFVLVSLPHPPQSHPVSSSHGCSHLKPCPSRKVRLAASNEDKSNAPSSEGEKTMKRPVLDWLATLLFQLEMDRVDSSSEVDSKGRFGEPMAWSESKSLANKFSTVIANNSLGYRFKQFVADITAGDYNEEETQRYIDDFITNNPVAMFSFTTCPFCRRAKDALDEMDVPFAAIELDEITHGNAVRAQLGKFVQRTSVPAVFLNGQFIGGCNDGPNNIPGGGGLIPLIESGQFEDFRRSK